ncbi:hypothetical protein LCGC14_0813600 [marine sediment metagenome]|uniref:Uncharacterized protein n=1 Tax=marine sediment metagenome TaxID=412755 RepID=A0A0F9STC8_9ZZZZ
MTKKRKTKVLIKRKSPLRERVDEQRRTILKLQADVDKVAGQMIDARRSNGKLMQRNEEMLHELGEMNDKIEEMYRESYALVKCLNATREEWLKRQEVIASNRRTMTFNASTIVASPKDEGAEAVIDRMCRPRDGGDDPGI